MAHWAFEALEDAEGRTVTLDLAGNQRDEFRGHSRLGEGVRGNCLVPSEHDSETIRPAGSGSLINSETFTVKAWIAPRSYPWNWAPILMQRDEAAGFHFGIDGDGRLGLHVAVAGQWLECNSEMPFPGLLTEHQWNSDSREWQYSGPGKPARPEPFGEKAGKPTIPQLRWSHVAGSFDPSVGIRIFLDGKPLATAEVQGDMTPAANSELRIGRDTRPMRPTHTERPKNTNPFNYSFDEHAFKLVCWHGINNYPVWYAENDIGLMWEAVETSGPVGCHEAMMDRQCRYSHVRVLESNDARVRIHWRHAPCNIEYGLANLDGDESKLDWAETGTPKNRNIENASILKYNIKATAKPFMILHPELAKVAIEGNGKPWPHCFFWRNHWPVSAIPSDGKQIYMVDGRPSSTCVSGNTYTTRHPLNERTENSLRQIWLLGMTTDRSAGAQAPLARSWSRPPEIAVESGSVTLRKYSLAQRCYVLTCKKPIEQPIEMVIAASKESPVVNIPLVIKNFGDSEVELELDGKPVPRGKDFRYSHGTTFEGTNLCAWFRLESMKPVRLGLSPK